MTQQLTWDELLRHFGVILGRTSAQSDGILLVPLHSHSYDDLADPPTHHQGES